MTTGARATSDQDTADNRELDAGRDRPDDLGLFGPTSVTWRVQLEPVLWVAGMRALLLQSLHPQVMRATFQNSALFDPEKAWPRFQRTVNFVSTRTFGSRHEVETAAARVRRLHSSLRGRNPDGTTIALDDPQHLLWVHNAEIDSYATVARRAGVVDDAEADAFVAESVHAAQVVGLDPAWVPTSRAELAAYFARVRPQLQLTDEARHGVGGLLTPQQSAPVGVGVALSSIAAVSLTTLPRWARRMYGLPGLPTTDLGVSVALQVLRTVTDLLPDLPAPPEIERARRLVREAHGASDPRQVRAAQGSASGPPPQITR